MKKIFSVVIALFAMVCVTNAQYGPTKFTDNVSVEVKGGITTPMTDLFGGISPVVGIQVEKYVTPWLGFAVDANTAVAKPYGATNPHTMFDAVNVNLLGKANLFNTFNYDGTRKFFEPVVFGGIGWGHHTCDEFVNRNYVVTKIGAELNFNLGKEKAWAVRVTPAAIWGPVNNGTLNVNNGNFEITAGIVYHFKNKDGNRHFTKVKLYDQSEINMLKAQLRDMRDENARARNMIKRLSDKVINIKAQEPIYRIDTVYINLNTHSYFNVGSAKIVSLADVRNLANSLDKTKHYAIIGYASEEGDSLYNEILSRERAENIYNTLIEYGFPKENLTYAGEGPTKQFSDKYREDNRVVVIKQK